jgi:lysophospholipase L1-like esterase
LCEEITYERKSLLDHINKIIHAKKTIEFSFQNLVVLKASPLPNPNPYPNRIVMPGSRAMYEIHRILCIGDSYTIGESVAQMETWPYRVAAELPTAPSIQVIAKTGWTTDELQAAISTEELAGRLTGTFDLVTLLIGVNNQYRARSCEDYLPQFIQLLNTALKYANNNPSRVCVLSIPDWAVTPFALNADSETLKQRTLSSISTDIDEFNAAAKEAAESKSVSFIDITPLTREAPQNSHLVAPDGLHPSGADYARWAKKVINWIESQ